MPSTARIEYDYIMTHKLKGILLMVMVVQCFDEIVFVLNDIDNANKTKISEWNINRKRQWLPNIISLLDIVMGDNLYELIEDTTNYKYNIDDQRIIESYIIKPIQFCD